MFIKPGAETAQTIPDTYTVSFSTEAGEQSITGFVKGQDDDLLESFLKLLEAMKNAAPASHRSLPSYVEFFEAPSREIAAFYARTEQACPESPQKVLDWGVILNTVSSQHVEIQLDSAPAPLAKKSTRSLIIRTYAGDADYFETFTLEGFTDEHTDLFEHLVKVLKDMLAAYPNGRGGGSTETYRDSVNGFDSWFTTPGEDYAPFENSLTRAEVEAFLEATKQKHLQAWPLDSSIVEGYYPIETSGFHGEHTLDSVTLRTYDSEGRMAENRI